MISPYYDGSMRIVRHLAIRLLIVTAIASLAACNNPNFRPVSPSEYSGGPLSNPLMGGGG
jgi:hypothetical protein